MKCMSCGEEAGWAAKVFQHLIVCANCKKMADRAAQEITREIDRAREQALNWLEQHVLEGGLLRGGDGTRPVDVVRRTFED